MAGKEKFPFSKPGEELAYWRIYRGEKVSLNQMRNEAPLSAVAAEGLVTRKEASSEIVYDSNGQPIDTVIFKPEEVAKRQNQRSGSS